MEHDIYTVKRIFSKDINAVKQMNINEATLYGIMMGPDNRPYWTTNKVVSYGRKRNGAYKYQ